MKKVFCILIVAFTFILSGCSISFDSGNGVIVLNYTEEGIDFSEERTVDKFDSFSSHGPFNVYFVQSDQQKILVEGKEEFVKKTITEVSDNALSIRLEDGKYVNLVLRVTVFSPYIEDMTNIGSGKLTCGSVDMAGAELDLTTMGSGGISADNITCKELSLSTSGSGSISIEKAEVADEMELITRGSGSISVNGRCRKVYASTSGSGSIYGSLEYSEINKSQAGSGRIVF